MESPRVVHVVLLGSLLLVGCAQSRQIDDPASYARTTPVAQARSTWNARVDQALAKASTAGTELGRAHEDRCDPGNDNWKGTSVLRFRCELGTVLFLAPDASDAAGAAASLGRSLAAAGCPAPDLTASATERLIAVKEPFLEHVSAHCGDGTPLTVMAGHDLAPEVIVQYPIIGITATGIVQTPLQAAQVQAVQRATPFVWLIQAGGYYYEEKR